MSGTPINLNKVRKARARVQKRAQADANAARFGRSKADKTADGAEAARHARMLDGAALETPPNGADDGVKKS